MKKTWFHFSRSYRLTVLCAIDYVLTFLAVSFALFLLPNNELPLYWLRLQSLIPHSDLLWLSGVFYVHLLLFFMLTGVYRSITRYTTFYVVQRVVLALLGVSAVYACVMAILGEGMARQTWLFYTIFVLLWLFLLIGYRFVAREYLLARRFPKSESVLIYGAGDNGQALCHLLQMGRVMQPVAFIDDNPKLAYKNAQGVNIYPRSMMPNLLERYAISTIFLAIPSLGAQDRQLLFQLLNDYPLKVLPVPTMQSLLHPRLNLEILRGFDIEELFDRKPAQVKPELMNVAVHHQAILVTGAGGSIGTELCRSMLAYQPKRIVLLEQSEWALYQVHSLLNDLPHPDTEIIPILDDMHSSEVLASILKQYEIKVIYHAAAYKHVPMVEMNPYVGIENNVFKTMNLLNAIEQSKVQHAVLISTDKAVRPTNVMGVSKRICEQMFAAMNARGCGCCLSMVRFGNVVDSSGSVIPLFRKQIINGGPVTVTHPEVTRFFMSIPEAAQLVLQSTALAQGGDLFLLEMGKSFKIIEIAKKMIHLAGLQVRSDDHPQGDIEIKIIGLRPGEKLFEELLIDSNAQRTEHPQIYRAVEEFMPYDELQEHLQLLRVATQARDWHAVLQQLKTIVPEYLHDGTSHYGSGKKGKFITYSSSGRAEPLRHKG